MNTYIALFRGINVGGKTILPMKNLVEILEGMGCEKVKTYIQSGNAVLQCNKNRSSNHARDLSSEILERYGFEPKVLLLEKAELQDAIDNNPFETDDGKALHFFFLDSHPAHPDLEQLMSVKSKSEEFKLNKNIFYLYAPDGVGRSKLAAKVEQALGVPATARNWNTVSKLMVMVGQAWQDKFTVSAPNTGSSRTAAPPLATAVICQKCALIEKESRRSRRCPLSHSVGPVNSSVFWNIGRKNVRHEETDEIVQKILEKIGQPVHFQYPPNEGHKRGILKDRAVMLSPGSTGVPYWDVVDLIEFAGESERWLRIGYYRKPSTRLVWGSQTTITEPMTVWKQLLVQAAREKPWFMSLLNDVMKELQR